jgi:hypothetical protein
MCNRGRQWRRDVAADEGKDNDMSQANVCAIVGDSGDVMLLQMRVRTTI